MSIRATRHHAFKLLCFALFVWMPVAVQASSDRPLNNQPINNSQNSAQPEPPSNPAVPGADYTGMYGFLREGEFVQITVEDQGRVIGYVSRYADPQGEGGFLEHLFTSGKLDGNRLEFATEAVNGISFEFHGRIERGDGKSRPDEAYYILKGTLLENATDKAKKTSSTPHDVELKSFPQNVALPPASEKK